VYYFVNMTTALQFNDHQINVFEHDSSKIALVNIDLRCVSGEQDLYGVVTQNDARRLHRKNGKWQWKMAECLTATQVLAKYSLFGLHSDDLPLSSRGLPRFRGPLDATPAVVVHVAVLDGLDFENVAQIKNRNKNRKQREEAVVAMDEGIAVKLDKKAFESVCRKFWNKYPEIPIVVNERKRKSRQNKQNVARAGHWIEWLKLIPVSASAVDLDDAEMELFVGISCRLDEDSKQWMVTSFCLDKGDILNKHRLCGLPARRQRRYTQYFEQFETNIKEIRWVSSER
jgi:hypothetical protein